MGFEAEYYGNKYKEESLNCVDMGKSGYWRKKDGNLIKISDMTNSHIENCLNLLDTSIVKYINKCISHNVEFEIPEDWSSKWDELVKELDKRTIN